MDVIAAHSPAWQGPGNNVEVPEWNPVLGRYPAYRLVVSVIATFVAIGFGDQYGNDAPIDGELDDAPHILFELFYGAGVIRSQDNYDCAGIIQPEFAGDHGFIWSAVSAISPGWVQNSPGAKTPSNTHAIPGE